LHLTELYTGVSDCTGYDGSMINKLSNGKDSIPDNVLTFPYKELGKS